MVQLKEQPWYMAIKVPTKPANKALGLEGIRVFKANDNQRAYGIVCNCQLDLTCGSIRITVAESKNKPGTLYLAVPGTENVGGQWYENVQLKYELKAQVLKYIDSMLE